MSDHNTAALRTEQAREHKQDRDYAARLERAKGYVAQREFELIEAVRWLYDRHKALSSIHRLPETEYVKLERAIASGDLCEAGRLLRDAATECVALELKDDPQR